MRYYIADCHFFHEELNRTMDCRGFADAAEMNAYMLQKWNAKVRPRDEVVILGDLSLGDARETNGLLEQLNGRLYLIQGNHDRFLHNSGYNAGRFVWIHPYKEMRDNKRKVVLSHYPILCYNGQYRRDERGEPTTWMLYGHVHDTTDQRLLERFIRTTRTTIRRDRDGSERPIPCQMINCFCMYSDYTPLTLDEWIENDRLRSQEQI